MEKNYDDIMKECRQVEKVLSEFNRYCSDIQTADLFGETRMHLQVLLQAELHREVTSAIVGIEYSAQRQEDRIEGYKEQAERQKRQIQYLQDQLQAERTEHRSIEEEWDKLQADLQDEKRKRIEAEWKLAVYMIKH